jgi:hypothetical protein
MNQRGRQNYRWQIAVSPKMRDQLCEEATARGLKPSDLVRYLVIDFLNRSRTQEERRDPAGKEEANV